MNEIRNDFAGRSASKSNWAKDALFCGLCLVAAMTVVGFLTRFDPSPKMLSAQLNAQQSPLHRVSEESPLPAAAEDAVNLDGLDLTIAKVDAAFSDQWAAAGLEVAQEVDSLTYARRIALGLAGTVPSLEEIRAFEGVSAESQNRQWVEHLLRDERTSYFLAERLARAFVGVEDGPFLVFRRNRFVVWLANQFRKNRPYDQLVKHILRDDGIWTQNPAVNFYARTVAQDDDEGKVSPVLLAGRTSRAFLGMRIDCLQCHDDFLGNVNLGDPADPSGGMQTDFHSLAAFFASTQVSLSGISDAQEEVDYEVQLLGDSEESVVAPMVPFLRSLDGQEPVARQRLANWVTHPQNRPFARALVNRIWAITYGRPLIEPVDDIPLAGPFPEALEILVDDFIGNGYDLHRLIRAVTSVKPARLDSKADFEIREPHERQFAVFPMRRLRADQVAGAIVQSSSLMTIDAGAHVFDRIVKFGNQNDFIVRFGDPGEDEFDEKGETVTQKLMMMNGSMLAERINEGIHSVVHLSALSPDSDRLLETIYLAALTRRPSDAEVAHFLPKLNSAVGDQKKECVQDIYWALVNSVEFAWNH